LQEGMRKIPVLGARRNIGRQMFVESPNDYIYLPVNPSGVMAIIFASSLLIFPSTIMQFVGRSDPAKYIGNLFSNVPFIKGSLGVFSQHHFVQNVGSFLATETANFLSYYHWEHSLLYYFLIILFAYFYASIVLQPRDIAENLRRSGRAIQGIRPGRPTAEFLERTINRLVFIGANAIAIIAILPIHVEQLTYVQTLQGLGSTSLIILVGVAIDTQRQIITHALSASYQARGLFKPRGQQKNI
jgi:preprotein translocase subunit SecY